jgi:hypothetical protein
MAKFDPIFAVPSNFGKAYPALPYVAHYAR